MKIVEEYLYNRPLPSLLYSLTCNLALHVRPFFYLHHSSASQGFILPPQILIARNKEPQQPLGGCIDNLEGQEEGVGYLLADGLEQRTQGGRVGSCTTKSLTNTRYLYLCIQWLELRIYKNLDKKK